MKTIRALFAILALALTAHHPALAEELTREKRADIEKLLDMTGAMAVGQQMSTAVVEQLTQVLKQSHPEIPGRALAVLPDEINSVFRENLPALRTAIVPLYHKHFTGQEIKELIRFYTTDVGRKTVSVMPALVQESMALGQQWGETLGPQIDRRVTARLKKEGVKL